MKKFLLLMAVVAGLAPAASAEFEGILYMQMRAGKPAMEMRVYVSKAGMRMVMVPASNPSMAMTSLMLKEKPGVMIQINDKQKTFMEIPLPKPEAAAVEGITVKDLGQEKLLGYKCKHILMTHPKWGETELWTTRDIAGYDVYAKLQNSKGMEGVQDALKKAGAEGFAMKSIHRTSGKGAPVMVEVTKVERTSLPGTLFQVPAGYTKTEGPGGAGMPPEAMKAMQEQMKNMSPEQKAMMEKMMKRKEK